MKITNIGGATAIIEHKGKRILFDPWLDEGIFHGAWYHYPPLRMGIPDLGRFDYIYISHIHEDHCSAGTIKHLNKDAELFLIDRPPYYVQKFLESQEFHFKKIHSVKPYTPMKIDGNLMIDMVEADPAHELNHVIDSGLVMKWDNFVIYNANDCPPYPGAINYILKTYKKVDLALLPYAGGSSYPSCYSNLTEEQKFAEKDRIFTSGLNQFVENVQALQPRYVMPFADQYVIGGSRSHLNKYMPHPASTGVVKEALAKKRLETSLLLLNSAQSFEFKTERKTPDEPFYVHSQEEKDAYVQTYLREKKYDHEFFAVDRRVPLERLVLRARERLWGVQQKSGYYPAFHYYLDIPDRKRRFEISLNQAEIREKSWEEPPQQPYLRMSADSTLMMLLLVGHISWNIADAALFVDYDRQPNVFDPKLQAYVNHLRI